MHLYSTNLLFSSDPKHGQEQAVKTLVKSSKPNTVLVNLRQVIMYIRLWHFKPHLGISYNTNGDVYNTN